jgi:diguanylate cyclase (GGDEF)-like protein
MAGKSKDSTTTLRVRMPRATAPISRGATLVVIYGGQLGQCIDLHDVPVIIGRGSSCDVQIEHKSVSRQHCKVWHDNGRFFVRDLGSTNRTYVNERDVEEAELREGDHLTIGDTVLKFVPRGSLEARYHDAMYELATIDSLTQLYNRRKFREHLDAQVARAQAEGAPLSLVFVDLDHFKSVNDRFGHLAGDEVLRAVSGALRKELRASDIAGRLGGEEFAIVMPDTALADAVERAEGLRQTVFAARCDLATTQQRVTASIGVVQWAPPMRTASDLMKNADAQLFRAKAAGRNRVWFPGKT